MKRPKRTREQRAYDKVMRKLERLKRAAVKLAVADDPDDNDTYTMAVTDLVGAAQSYALSLPRSELRRMVK